MNIMPNKVIEKDGYYISFNPRPDIGFEGEETALVKDGKFYILIGDFCREYDALKSFDECFEFFESKPELKGSWSN